MKEEPPNPEEAERKKREELDKRAKVWLAARLSDFSITGADMFRLPRSYPGAEKLKYDKAGLRKRFFLMSKLLHPDKNPGEEATYTFLFQRLQGAFETAQKSGKDYSNTQNLDPSDSEDDSGLPHTPRRPPPSGAPGGTPKTSAGPKKRTRRARTPSPPPPPPSDPAEAAERAETSHADPAKEPRVYHISITAGWKKKPGTHVKPVNEATRRRRARYMVDRAHEFTPAWKACRLYSDSVERGKEGGGQQAHHVQGFRTVESTGGPEGALAATEAYYRACYKDPEPGVVLRLVVKLIGDDQTQGEMFCYTFKQWHNREHFYNHHGGPDYNDEVCRCPKPNACDSIARCAHPRSAHFNSNTRPIQPAPHHLSHTAPKPRKMWKEVNERLKEKKERVNDRLKEKIESGEKADFIPDAKCQKRILIHTRTTGVCPLVGRLRGEPLECWRPWLWQVVHRVQLRQPRAREQLQLCAARYHVCATPEPHLLDGEHFPSLGVDARDWPLRARAGALLSCICNSCYTTRSHSCHRCYIHFSHSSSDATEPRVRATVSRPSLC